MQVAEALPFVLLLCADASQNTAGQFTDFGYRQLQGHVRPNELFVLFRNNHFRCAATLLLSAVSSHCARSVGFKRGDCIYLLETDISFRATVECWSQPALLSCTFVGEDFMPIERAPNTPPPPQQEYNMQYQQWPSQQQQQQYHPQQQQQQQQQQ